MGRPSAGTTPALDAEWEQAPYLCTENVNLLNEPHCSPAKVTKSAHEDSTRRDLAAGMHRCDQFAESCGFVVIRSSQVASVYVKRASTVAKPQRFERNTDQLVVCCARPLHRDTHMRASCSRMRPTRARPLKISTTSRSVCTKRRRRSSLVHSPSVRCETDHSSGGVGEACGCRSRGRGVMPRPRISGPSAFGLRCLFASGAVLQIHDDEAGTGPFASAQPTRSHCRTTAPWPAGSRDQAAHAVPSR